MRYVKIPEHVMHVQCIHNNECNILGSVQLYHPVNRLSTFGR
jgi:hypothetical protein